MPMAIARMKIEKEEEVYSGKTCMGKDYAKEYRRNREEMEIPIIIAIKT